MAAMAAVADGGRLLNAGAGRSVSIERQLAFGGANFVADRVDVDDARVPYEFVGEVWRCSIDRMSDVPSETYDGVFANYVLEHVARPFEAAGEVRRVLKPGGVFATSIPNPSAPQFRLARRTSSWLHEKIRGVEAWDVVYAFRDPNDLARILTRAGLVVECVAQFPGAGYYLDRFPGLRRVGRGYDALVERAQLQSLMGDACIVARRPART